MLLLTVVLYNKTLSTSDTLKGLVESSAVLKKVNADVLLWDNSKTSMSEKDIDELNRHISLNYLHEPGNKPLSFIYNTVIEKISASNKYQYLVILDDDSKISIPYFEEIIAATTLNTSNLIFLPIVKNNQKIISPAKFYYLKGSYFKTINPGIYKGNLFAINSGMVIAASFFKQYNFRYDERLTNYGTDNYIMHFANEKKIPFYILNYTMDHSLSFFDHPDVAKRLEVFRQIKKANKIVFSANIFQSVMISWYNFISSFKNAVKYKSFKFFS